MRPERHFILETAGGKQWVFIAPSDEAAVKMPEYRAVVDCWADGVVWSVSRYYPLVVDDEGRTESPSETSNMVASGTWKAADLIESQASELSRLREECDALRARTTPPEEVTNGWKRGYAIADLVEFIRLRADEYGGAPGMSEATCLDIARLIEHAYLPPVAPSPDPKDGEQ